MKTIRFILSSLFFLGQIMIFSIMVLCLFDFRVFAWVQMNIASELYSLLMAASCLIFGFLPSESSKKSGKEEKFNMFDYILLVLIIITIINTITLLCYFGIDKFFDIIGLWFCSGFIVGTIKFIIEDNGLEKMTEILKD